LQLHIFVRRDKIYAEVEVKGRASVAALQKAVAVELKLDVPPDRVRLLREVEDGGTPVLLDSRKKLAEQSIKEGSSVLVEVVELENGVRKALDDSEKLAAQGVGERSRVVAMEGTKVATAPLPAPLLYSNEVLGGEPIVVAELQGTPEFIAPYPFFLTPLQLAEMEEFLRFTGPPSTPKVLMITGTIKSGKTRIVTDIIPRLLSLYYSQAPIAIRRRPVLFHHEFTPDVPAAPAVRRLVGRLRSFSRSLGISLEAPEETPEDDLLEVTRALALRIGEEGGQLWLLLDEVGAPVVASKSHDAAAFVQLFKDMLSAAHPSARIVATGSGMVTLLKSMADAAVNGFTLWGCASHVRVGQEPSPALALAMAQRLQGAYSTHWPPAALEFLTPQRLLDSLAFEEHGGLTSTRPSLVAFLASLLGMASIGSPPEVLRRAVEEVLFKLRVESRRDTAVGLERMKIGERLALRQLAVHGILPADYPLSPLARLLCEDENGEKKVAVPLLMGGKEAAPPSPTGHSSGTLLRLLPPYGTLLGRWIRPDGMLSITNLATGGQPLAPRVVKSLLTMTENMADFSEGLKRDMSSSVLGALAKCGMGVPQQPNSLVRPPLTVAELMAIPAIIYLIETLEFAANNSAGKQSPSSTAKLFREAAEAGSEEQAKFMAKGGIAILRLLRNVMVHVSFETEGVREYGLTEVAVDTVVQWAADEVVQSMGGRYYFNEHGLLLRGRKSASFPSSGATLGDK
jgi:hypothetical protein